MASDIHIKIGDIKGESQSKGKKDFMDVFSWSWGMAQTGGGHKGGGAGAGKVSVQDLTFTKPVDKATPVLMKYCCSGKHSPEALLTVRKAGGDNPVEFVKIKLEEVIISAISAGGSPHDETQSETVTLNFAKVTYDYQAQKDDGSADGGPVTVSYNIKTDETK